MATDTGCPSLGAGRTSVFRWSAPTCRSGWAPCSATWPSTRPRRGCRNAAASWCRTVQSHPATPTAAGRTGRAPPSCCTCWTGRLTLTLGTERVTAAAGDVVSFTAEQHHRYAKEGDAPSCSPPHRPRHGRSREGKKPRRKSAKRMEREGRRGRMVRSGRHVRSSAGKPDVHEIGFGLANFGCANGPIRQESSQTHPRLSKLGP